MQIHLNKGACFSLWLWPHRCVLAKGKLTWYLHACTCFLNSALHVEFKICSVSILPSILRTQHYSCDHQGMPEQSKGEREKKHNKNNRISFIPLSFPPLFSLPLPAVITSLPLQASSCLSRLRVYRSVLFQQSPALTSRCCCRSHPARRRLSCLASGFNRPEESVLEAIYSRQMTTSLLLNVSAADCGLLFFIVCC